jgi:hypothetical protein
MSHIGVQENGAPDLSVVVPSVNGWGDLEGCLEALERQREVDVQTVVVDRVGDSVRGRIKRRFPSVTLLEVGDNVTIPQMRALAFDEARAPVVAVIEDHVLVPQGWAARMLREREGGARVVGGAVENAATETWVDWAAFLCEYSQLLPPLQEGSVEWLTGNNTMYAKEVLDRHRDVTHAGLWENHLHDAVRASGDALICRPDIVVGHKKHYTIWEYVSQRFLYARSYAGARVRDAPVPRRVAFGIASFALPPVLLYRILSSCLRKQVDRWIVVRSIPLLGVFVSSWALGEVVGSWFGPGNALAKVC